MDFGKLGDDKERNKCGTGLGLSICKQIIEAMGGSVLVSSQVGRGSDFIINIKTKCIVKKAEFTCDPPKEVKSSLDSQRLNSDRSHYFEFIQ